jgi:hypothetical protein
MDEVLPAGTLLSTPIGKLPTGMIFQMDVCDEKLARQERRRDRLAQILLTVKQAELSRKCGVSQSYISRCLLKPGDKNAKNIGEDVVRKFEIGLDKPEGWFDEVERQTPMEKKASNDAIKRSPISLVLAAEFDKLPDNLAVRLEMYTAIMQILTARIHESLLQQTDLLSPARTADKHHA